ncbi:hypothetical protein CNR22_18595 [Sphingobacteriaceae bacterium]|nr:hypothetical protein CNR22_18595 [Sphingobacteriaceae bacterium]
MLLVKGRKKLKEFKNAVFTVYLKDTGVLGIEAESDMTYDVDDVRQIIDNTKYIAGNQKYLILVKTGPMAVTTFAALKLLAEPDAAGYAHAKAYVISTISQRLMANFFMYYFKPAIPIKFFKDPRLAEVWLLKTYRHLLR